jgi:hypothetical protein
MITHPLTEQDLWPLPVYEQVRDEFRSKVIEHKKDRRVTVGPFMTFVFEDRLTVKFQTMEILRAEKLTRPQDVREELDTFNTMLPGPRELSATLLIELTDESAAKETLRRLIGLTGAVFFEAAGARAQAQFDPGREDAEKGRLAAVHYLRFPLAEAQAQALKAGAPARLVIEHPEYRHALDLPARTAASLASDLA